MKKTDPILSWEAQRKLWNREGLCARQQCDQPHHELKNNANGLLYCEECADKIKKGGIVTFTAAINQEERT